MTPREYNIAVQRAYAEWKPKRKKPRQKQNSGKRKHNRRAWYANYLKSDHWKATRLLALEHYGNRCSICGSSERLQVHHKHYSSLKHETMADLQVLCVGCHENSHEGKPGVFDPITREYLRLQIGKE